MSDFSSESSFSHIFVVEFLSDGEMHTGRQLFRETIQSLCDEHGLTARLHVGHSRAEFLAALEQVRLEAVRGALPIVHIDAHGTPLGLELPTGETMTWTELAAVCRPISVASSNHLLLSLSACHGARAMNAIDDLHKPTPFWSVIGPRNTSTAGELEARVPRFFRELFTTGSLEEATAHHGPDYEAFVCERMFARAVAKLIRDNRHPGRRREVLEKIKRRGIEEGKCPPPRAIRDAVRKALSPHAIPFDQYKKTFLLADHPRNQGRFGITLEGLLNEIGQE